MQQLSNELFKMMQIIRYKQLKRYYDEINNIQQSNYIQAVEIRYICDEVYDQFQKDIYQKKSLVYFTQVFYLISF